MTSDRLLFSSKIDLWLLVLLLALPAGCFVAVVQLWDQLSGALWWVLAILAVAAIVPLWLLVSTRYSMSENELFVRCGPFKWTVPIAEITKIERTRNPLSSPALSLDRLRIDYGPGRSIMISPEPRKAFLQQLEHRRQQTSA